MEQTKQRHLDFLKELSERHRNGGAHTISERVHLDQLLKAHDAQVTLFRNAMAELMRSDLQAHGALIEYIKRFNATLGTDQRPH